MRGADRESLFEPGETTFNEWYGFEEALDFLQDGLRGSVAVYLALDSRNTRIYLAAALIPMRELTPDAREDLKDWNTDVLGHGWGYGGGFHEDGGPDYSIIAPFAWERPPILQKATPIIWRRENSLVKGRPTYYEANPEITHIHDLHWVEERSAYCALDELGNVREVIRIARDSATKRVTQITIEDDVLGKHMALGDYALVRFFDIDRFEDADVFLAGSLAPNEVQQIERRNLRARLTPLPAGEGVLVGARLRGVQLALPPQGEAKRQLLDDRRGGRYETFVAHDFKHNRVAEISCAPDALASYFTDTGKPFQTTPAFFRREVLARYQSDTDKYTVTDREISCRSSWSLRFDVNEAGQVHAYLCDLQYLPYAEQQYWRSFNEAPKAPISKRSFKTDFEGSWDLDPEPLRDLKARLAGPIRVEHADHGRPVIWVPPPDRQAMDEVHYLAGESKNEWAQAVGALHRLVVEGFQESALRDLAIEMGEEAEDVRGVRSIKLLERIVVRLGFGEEQVKAIVEPLGMLHHIRSKTASHRIGTEGETIVREARREHGDLAKHFKALVRDVDGAVQQLRLAAARAGTQD